MGTAAPAPRAMRGTLCLSPAGRLEREPTCQVEGAGGPGGWGTEGYTALQDGRLQTWLWSFLTCVNFKHLVWRLKCGDLALCVAGLYCYELYVTI